MNGEQLLNQIYLEDISTLTFHNIYSSEERTSVISKKKKEKKREKHQIVFYWELNFLRVRKTGLTFVRLCTTTTYHSPSPITTHPPPSKYYLLPTTTYPHCLPTTILSPPTQSKLSWVCTVKMETYLEVWTSLWYEHFVKNKNETGSFEDEADWGFQFLPSSIAGNHLQQGKISYLALHLFHHFEKNKLFLSHSSK